MWSDESKTKCNFGNGVKVSGVIDWVLLVTLHLWRDKLIVCSGCRNDL